MEITLNKDNFESVVLKSDKPVIVDFWAPWCGPCQMMGPVISKIAEEADGRFVVGKVNIDDEEELSDKYSVMSIPTIKVFKNGEVFATRIGATSKEKILQMIDN